MHCTLLISPRLLTVVFLSRQKSPVLHEEVFGMLTYKQSRLFETAVLSESLAGRVAPTYIRTSDSVLQRPTPSSQATVVSAGSLSSLYNLPSASQAVGWKAKESYTRAKSSYRSSTDRAINLSAPPSLQRAFPLWVFGQSTLCLLSFLSLSVLVSFPNLGARPHVRY